MVRSIGSFFFPIRNVSVVFTGIFRDETSFLNLLGREGTPSVRGRGSNLQTFGAAMREGAVATESPCDLGAIGHRGEMRPDRRQSSG